MTINICTWNVNGIRACVRKGFLQWMEGESPDILCIQETKAREEQLSTEVKSPEGYSSFFASAEKKGYSGVALYTKKTPQDVQIGLDIDDFDSEGRTIIAQYPEFVLISAYFPNSQNEGKRLPYKLAFDEAIARCCDEFRKSGKEVIICGDFNAAHEEIDLANPKQNVNNAGFLPEERQWVDEMLSQGFRDVFRERHPGEKGHYTWWSYRTRARERNAGWRLDYFLSTAGISEKIKEVSHLSEVMGSDHCPVRLVLNL